ncbi:MAG: HAD family hydrolase [Acidobacteria bacterium]|nr:HAD family hydrolase [Acidobacteriota bacterium]
MITAVLFDIDGTLVDSNDAHASAWVDALAQAGQQVSFEQVRPLIGMGGDKLLPTLAGIDPESGDGKAIAESRASIFRERYLPAPAPTDGAADLVRALNAHDLRLGIATSAKAEEVAALLRVAGADGLFTATGSSDDVDRSKPDPDIVHAALARVGVSATSAVMVGDTPYDIEAARRAGVPCIALRCGGWWSDADFAGAAQIVDTPRQLLDRWRDGDVPTLR